MTGFGANSQATFSVAANVINGDRALLAYQWQRDGVDLPGANEASYTTPALRNTDVGAKFGFWETILLRPTVVAPAAQDYFGAIPWICLRRSM